MATETEGTGPSYGRSGREARGAPRLPGVSVAASPVPSARRPRLPAGPWAILGVALALRVVVVVATPGYAPFGDPADYDRIGRFLEYFGTYPPTTYADPLGPAALRPPAYPYFLAGIYEVVGVRWTVVRLIAALLGTLGVWLLWDLVRRLFDARLATWTAGVAAVLPSLVWVGGGLTAESLFIPLSLAAGGAAPGGSWPRASCSGSPCSPAPTARSWCCRSSSRRGSRGVGGRTPSCCSSASSSP